MDASKLKWAWSTVWREGNRVSLDDFDLDRAETAPELVGWFDALPIPEQLKITKAAHSEAVCNL